jgi:hypothetical protein
MLPEIIPSPQNHSASTIITKLTPSLEKAGKQGSCYRTCRIAKPPLNQEAATKIASSQPFASLNPYQHDHLAFHKGKSPASQTTKYFLQF